MSLAFGRYSVAITMRGLQHRSQQICLARKVIGQMRLGNACSFCHFGLRKRFDAALEGDANCGVQNSLLRAEFGVQ
jgi:hypothetical protein